MAPVILSVIAIPSYQTHAGLPQKERTKLENIHFLCCSNRVDALELVEPLVDDLLELEEGIPM